ncbi:Hypothetical predicted protein [Podarcis lilfordi]|uniref:Uncharacterized protein n=1 Tax=Podarcis lilfordi TaxID=74358 RepID=A0AA35K8P3_9SAUR|nr:Hypothetical predicted protein [Podarcis lilfordi]
MEVTAGNERQTKILSEKGNSLGELEDESSYSSLNSLVCYSCSEFEGCDQKGLRERLESTIALDCFPPCLCINSVVVIFLLQAEMNI